MFSMLQSPYDYNAMPSVFMDPMFLAPEPKRRRVHKSSVRTPPQQSLTKSYTPVALRYEVDETKRGYILSLHKRLPKDQLRNEINHELAFLKDQLYRPSYHYCGFFGGLVEEDADENLLTRQALNKLNLQTVCRRVARQAFKDYKIELNHRGDELSIVSHVDGVAKEFDLGINIDDLEVIGCQLDESCTNAVWKILLVNEHIHNHCDLEEDPITDGCRSSNTEQKSFQESLENQGSEKVLQSEPTIQEPEHEQSEESDTPFKITINFAQDQKAKQQKSKSPLLEEVEDEEVDRFRQLVSRAPTGSAILEDC